MHNGLRYIHVVLNAFKIVFNLRCTFDEKRTRETILEKMFRILIVVPFIMKKKEWIWWNAINAPVYNQNPK